MSRVVAAVPGFSLLCVFMLAALFVLAGLGLVSVTTSILVLSVAQITSLPFFYKNTHASVPVWISVWFLLSLAVAILLLPFSASWEASIIQLIGLFSIGVIFGYMYNQKRYGAALCTFVVYCASLFGLLSLYQTFIGPLPLLPTPTHGAQFIRMVFGHNNGGHLAMAGAVIAVIRVLTPDKNKLIWSLLAALNILTVILSFSRTAYVGLLVVLCLVVYPYIKSHTANKQRLSRAFLASFTAIFLILFIFATSEEAKTIPVLSSLHSFLKTHTGLPDKSLGGQRLELASLAFNAIADNPLTGSGANGYYWKYLQYTKQARTYSDSAHNILLDSAVDYGLAGGAVVAIILLFIATSSLTHIKKGPSKHISAYSAAAVTLSMTVSMIFDFAHKIPVFLVLFAVFAALHYSEKRTVRIRPFLHVLTAASSAAAFIGIQILFSQAVLRAGHPIAALWMFPASGNAYEQSILQSIEGGDITQSLRLLSLYEILNGNNPEGAYFIGLMHEKMGNTDTAIHYYQLTYSLHRYRDFPEFKRVYVYIDRHQGKEKADQFAAGYFSVLEEARDIQFHFRHSADEVQVARDFCREYNLPCPRHL